MRIKAILSAIFLLSAMGVASPVASHEPISAKQLLAWVMGGMSTDHLTAEVKSRGIAFKPDEKYIELMKSARASQNLLDLLPQAVKSASAPSPPSGADPAFEKLAAGAKALGAEDYASAGKSVAAAVQLEPKNADLFFALGGIFSDVDDWENAAQAYHEATNLSPDFLEGHLGMAYACYRVEDANYAEAESKFVLQRLPNDAEAHKDLGLALMC